MPLAVSATLILGLFRMSDAAQVEVNQAELAKVLAEGSLDARMEALRQVQAIQVDQRQPFILAALTGELDRLTQYRNERRFSRLRGQRLDPAEAVQVYILGVTEAVTEYKDPAIIKPLTPFVGTGLRVIGALVGFGELAVNDVVNFAVTAVSEHHPDAPMALVTLDGLLDRELSEAAKQSIVNVAAQSLTGGQSPAVIERAIDLAVKTGDLALVARVRNLVDDPREVRSLGINDAVRVALIQKRAASALANVRR